MANPYSWILTNISNSQAITVGVGVCPPIPPGASRDLLYFATQDEIVTNKVLANVIDSGLAILSRYYEGVLVDVVTSSNAMTLLDLPSITVFALDGGGGGGQGTSGYSGKSGYSGYSGTSGYSGIQATQSQQVRITFDGGGSAITGTPLVWFVSQFPGTISGYTLLADQSGSIVITVEKCTYSGFPGSLTSIVGSGTPPTLSSAQKAQDNTLTSWSLAVSSGDILQFQISSVATVQHVQLIMSIT